jgi:outer membrane protein TolC
MSNIMNIRSRNALVLLLWLIAFLVMNISAPGTAGAADDEREPPSIESPLLPPPLEDYLRDARGLTLSEAMKKVQEGNYMIKASREEEGAAQAGFDYAKSFGLPRVDLGLGYTISDNPVNVFAFKLNQGRFTMQDFDIQALNDPQSTTNFNAGLTIKYPLYTGGRVDLAMSAARENIQASRQATTETSRGMLSNMLQSYLSGALLMETIRVLDESLLLAQKQVKLAKSFYGHGMVVKSDVLSAEVYLSMTVQERNNFFGKLKNLNEVLNRLMGSDQGTRYSMQCTFDRVPEVKEKPEELEEMALRQRPDLLGYQHQRNALARMMTIEERSALPEVGLYGQAQHSDRGFFVQGSGDMTAGVYASVPIFDGGQRKAKVDEFRARLKAVDNKIDMLRLSIRGDVRESLNDYHTAVDNIRASESQVEQAAENLRIISNRYRAGLSTSLDVQQSETMQRQAKLARLSAYHNVQIAYYRILVATGSIMDTVALAPKECK